MCSPLQKPPVNREEIIISHSVVDINNGTRQDQIKVRLDLLHGANFNDPQPFRVMSYANAKLTL